MAWLFTLLSVAGTVVKSERAPVGTATVLPSWEGTGVSPHTFLPSISCVPGTVLSARTRPWEDGISVLPHATCTSSMPPRCSSARRRWLSPVSYWWRSWTRKGQGERSLQRPCPHGTVQARLRLMPSFCRRVLVGYLQSSYPFVIAFLLAPGGAVGRQRVLRDAASEVIMWMRSAWLFSVICLWGEWH